MNRFLALIVAVAALAVVAVGCGSSDDDGTTDSSASITKAEFVEQGNEICTEGNEEIESRLEEFAEENGLSGNDQPSAAQVEELTTEILVPSVAKQVDEIRELGVPAGEEKEAEAFLDNAELTVEEVEADPSLLTGGESSPFTAVNKEAIALGLTVCGQEV